MLPCFKKEDVDEDEVDGLYDTTKIFWDEHGNLRYGNKRITTKAREMELRAIMECDEMEHVPTEEEQNAEIEKDKKWQLEQEKKTKEQASAPATKTLDSDDDDDKPVDELQAELVEETPTWYIMESCWLASWLAHVQFDKINAPAPGPCRNNRLISYDVETKEWTGRFGLQMAMPNHAGDYRRVSEATWIKFKELYPGSGPAITMKFKVDPKSKANGFYDTSAWKIVDKPPAPKEQKKKKKKTLAPDQPAGESKTAEAAAEEARDNSITVKNEPKTMMQPHPSDATDSDDDPEDTEEVPQKPAAKRDSKFFNDIYFSAD